MFDKMEKSEWQTRWAWWGTLLRGPMLCSLIRPKGFWQRTQWISCIWLKINACLTIAFIINRWIQIVAFVVFFYNFYSDQSVNRVIPVIPKLQFYRMLANILNADLTAVPSNQMNALARRANGITRYCHQFWKQPLVKDFMNSMIKINYTVISFTRYIGHNKLFICSYNCVPSVFSQLKK